ncbi:MAG TPA: hypothetical protein VHV31_15880, partial [Nitrolancea sp.]|nr:hypothetical protein [Nitrolancea sp.]
ETLLLYLTAYLLFTHRDRLTVRDAFIAGIPSGFAVLTRLNIAIVLPIFALYVFLLASSETDVQVGQEETAPGLFQRVSSRLKRPFSRVAFEDWPNINVVRVTAAFLATPFFSVLLYLGLNYYRFDTIRDPAFGNILDGSLDIFVGLYGNLLSPGRSIFLYSPPLILALLMFRQFYRRFPYEALLVAGIAVCYIVLYSIPLDWDGGWSWGPRYLLAIVPFLMLPLGYFFTSRARIALAVAFGILGAGIQLLGIIINYSFVYWDWTYMKLVPSNAFLFVPGISPIPNNFRDLLAGKNVDMWIVWSYHQSGLMAVLGIAGISFSLFMAGLFFLIDGISPEMENVDDSERTQADYASD